VVEGGGAGVVLWTLARYLLGYGRAVDCDLR